MRQPIIDEAEREPLTGVFCGLNEIVQACQPMGQSMVERRIVAHPAFPPPLIHGAAVNSKRVWASQAVRDALDRIAAEGLQQ
jgi:hypothetical protein